MTLASIPATASRIGDQLLDAAVWRIAVEIVRPYSGRLRITETPSGRGLLVCRVGLDHLPDQSITISREGPVVVRPFRSGAEVVVLDRFVEEFLSVDDPVVEIVRLRTAAGLPSRKRSPRSSSDVLIYRLIAAFLSHSVLSRYRWECRSARGDGPELFAEFPGAGEEVRLELPDDPLGLSSHRYWFLLRNGRPQASLSTTGMVWTKDGRAVDVTALYNGRIWPVVAVALEPLLP